MKTPRNVSGSELSRALQRLGYSVVRQTGSHARLTTNIGGEHHVTVPMAKPIKVGTLQSILDEVAEYAGTTRAELLDKLNL